MAQKYSINTTKKIITATIEDLDAVEKEIVQMYINAGYILHKGKKGNWTSAKIQKWLEANVSKEAAEEFDKKADANWIAARTEFFETKKKIEEAKKAKEEEEAKKSEK